MIALDTNALLRHLVDDETAPEQCAAIRAEVSAALHERRTVFLPTLAIVEAVWVLGRRIKAPKAEIIAALRDLAAAPSSAGCGGRRGPAGGGRTAAPRPCTRRRGPGWMRDSWCCGWMARDVISFRRRAV